MPRSAALGYRLGYRMGYQLGNRHPQVTEIIGVFEMKMSWLGDLDSNQD